VSLNLIGIVGDAVDSMFDLGSEFVKAATYTRPPTFNPANGQTQTLEQTAAVTIFAVNFRPRELGLVSIQPGDEKIYIRASELASITDPIEGDYVIETVSGLRRDILSARLDQSGTLWTFQCTRGFNLDWGSIVDAAGANTEDWGDLTTATTLDDWGSVV
jgi:hypothetical protein